MTMTNDVIKSDDDDDDSSSMYDWHGPHHGHLALLI